MEEKNPADAKSPLNPQPATRPKPLTDVQADIAQILADAKLPERREDARTIADPARPLREPAQLAPKPKPIVERPEVEDGPVVPVRTLRHDLQAVVKDSKLSIVQAAALEEDKRAHSEEPPVSQQTDRSRHYTRPIVVALTFFTLGALLLGTVAVIISEQTVSGEPQFSTNLIFSEQVASFPLLENPQDIKRTLAATRASGGLTLGSVTRLVPTVSDKDADGNPIEREATAPEFLRALGAQAPEELLRTLEDEFFFGFHTVDEQAPIIVFRTNSYERAFGGMLAWEKTINDDLSPFFTGMSPLIKTEEGLVVQRTFSDAVMQNFDIRTLKDDNGTVQLYYSFPTRSLLIIAESQYSFPEILSRLRAERKL